MYFTQRMEAEEIAQELGAGLAEVIAALNDPQLLKPYQEQSQAAKLRAQICVNESAEEAARLQAELMRAGEAAGTQSVSQRAAKDILDRAGVHIDRESEAEIRIVFAGGAPKIGMPRTMEGGEDDGDWA